MVIKPSSERPGRKLYVALGLLLLMTIGLAWLLRPTDTPKGDGAVNRPDLLGYYDETQPNHRDITATVFWVGEAASDDNRQISNRSSAWIGDWVKAYGGIDDPENRCSYQPCGFEPRENPFYFALPFNDFTSEGKLKPEAILQRIPWYDGKPLPGQSIVKNHWISVTHQGRTAYAQWEDVGPFGEDDASYVFGSKAPRAGVGLDLSPATANYLRLEGRGKVSWRFVEPSNVPAGPWKQRVTTSGLDFE